MKVDVLAFGAHPDDVELSVGGTLLSLLAQGYTTGIVDVTRGEMGTRGTPEIRSAESQEAARLLGVQLRVNLDLPDGGVAVSQDSRERVIRVLREHRPQMVLAPLEVDLHPDHAQTGRLVKDAAFLAGLRRWETGQAPHRPRTVLSYFSHEVREPDLVVDITAQFEQKKRACLAYRSQFHDPNSQEPPTYISGSGFWAWWEARARAFGHRIGAVFGEAFSHQGPIPVTDLVRQFAEYGYYPQVKSIGGTDHE